MSSAVRQELRDDGSAVAVSHGGPHKRTIFATHFSAFPLAQLRAFLLAQLRALHNAVEKPLSERC